MFKLTVGNYHDAFKFVDFIKIWWILQFYSSKVTVIDANNPADVLESFHVCSSHLLCIASVPG